jgi:uncharacterized protein (DUF952 family)
VTRADDAGAADARTVFHIAFARDWDAAKRDGAYRISTRGLTLDDVGFIHAGFAHQVAGVGAAFYADVDEPLVLLVIDRDRLDVPVVVENLDGGDELFPHIYGPLPTTAVTEVRGFTVEA